MSTLFNLLQLLQKLNNLQELSYNPYLTPDNTIRTKTKILVNNGDSFKLNIQVTNRIISNELVHLTYKEIKDNDTGESWITEVAGSVKSDTIRANILQYTDFTSTHTAPFRGRETYFLYQNLILRFKYGSNQGEFYLIAQLTPAMFQELCAKYGKRELTKVEVDEILQTL